MVVSPASRPYLSRERRPYLSPTIRTHLASRTHRARSETQEQPLADQLRCLASWTIVPLDLERRPS